MKKTMSILLAFAICIGCIGCNADSKEEKGEQLLQLCTARLSHESPQKSELPEVEYDEDLEVVRIGDVDGGTGEFAMIIAEGLPIYMWEGKEVYYSEEIHDGEVFEMFVSAKEAFADLMQSLIGADYKETLDILSAIRLVNFKVANPNIYGFAGNENFLINSNTQFTEAMLFRDIVFFAIWKSNYNNDHDTICKTDSDDIVSFWLQKGLANLLTELQYGEQIRTHEYVEALTAAMLLMYGTDLLQDTFKERDSVVKADISEKLGLGGCKAMMMLPDLSTITVGESSENYKDLSTLYMNNLLASKGLDYCLPW